MSDKNFGVIVAKSAGFCPGVKRAIDCVLELSGHSVPIYTFGPIIHNAQVVRTLEEKNIKSINSLDEIKDKRGIIVIRAHGVTPETENEIRAFGLKVVDATCPLVKKVQQTIQKYAQDGYSTVIVGDKGHAEVAGLLGYTEGRGFVAADAKEAKKLPYFEKVNIVSQTTQEETIFEETARAVSQNAGETIISNTICQPTTARQKETKELACVSDMMIIVGGKNSANTTRLAQLCAKYCPNTAHIETENDLEELNIISPETISITAGASTPVWMADRVFQNIRKARAKEQKLSARILSKLTGVLVDSSIYTSLSAVALTYTAAVLHNIGISRKMILLSWLFVFSLTLINRTAEKSAVQTDRKLDVFRRNIFSMTAGFAAGFLAIILSLMIKKEIFYLSFALWVMGAAYPYKRIFDFNIKDILPGSKEIVTALGWSFVCVWLTAFQAGKAFEFPVIMATAYGVCAVFARSAMLGISAVESDLIVGRETFYKAFGKKITFSAIILAAFMEFAVLARHALSVGGFLPLHILLASAVIYQLICALLIYRRRIQKNETAQLVIDGYFFLLAFFAFISRMFN